MDGGSAILFEIREPLFEEESQYISSNRWSDHGPLTITHPSHISDLDKTFIEAERKLGYRIGDYNTIFIIHWYTITAVITRYILINSILAE